MPFDMRGQEICVGDVVAYPMRQGALLWMNVGTVTRVEELGPASRYFDPCLVWRVSVQLDKPTPGHGYTRYLSRLLVIEKATVATRGLC